MTVPIQPIYVEHIASGTATVFPFPFTCLQSDDLRVSINRQDAPSSTYAVYGLGDASGTVKFNQAPASGARVLIWLSVRPTRTIDYQRGGSLQAAVLNADFNRLWQAYSSVFGVLPGSLTAPFPEQIGSLPSALDRANRALGFDGEGNPMPIPSDLPQLEGALARAEGAASVAQSESVSAASSALGAEQAAHRSSLSQQQADAARIQAENAATAAALSIGTYYPTIAAGRAAVADGASFWVEPNGDDGLTRFTMFTRTSATAQIKKFEAVAAPELDAMISREVISSNLFNKLTVGPSGLSVSSVNGSFYSKANWHYSSPIPVEPGITYRLSIADNIAQYDSNGIFISGVTGKTITTAENVSFVRVALAAVNLNSVMFAKSSEFPTAYESYAEGTIVHDQKFDSSVVAAAIFDEQNTLESGLLVSQKSLSFLNRLSANIYDSQAPGVITGYRLAGTTGALVVSATNTVSDWIPVNAETDYSCYPEGNHTCFYDANKTFISGHGTGITAFTTPAGAAFMRTTVRATVRDAFTVIPGPTPPSRPDPYRRYAFNETIEGLSGSSATRWNGKKVNIIGNSITADADSWWRKTFTELGFSVARNYGIGGTAVGVRAAPWDTNAMCVRYAEMDPDADLVLINMPETNDFNQVPLGDWDSTDTSTYFGAAKAMAAGIVDMYPTKTIAWITMPPRYRMHQNPSTLLNGKTVWDYVNASIRVCEYYGIPVLDILRISQLRPFNATNGETYFRDTPPGFLHPNSIAHEMLGVQIKPWLLEL